MSDYSTISGLEVRLAAQIISKINRYFCSAKNSGFMISNFLFIEKVTLFRTFTTFDFGYIILVFFRLMNCDQGYAAD